MSEENKSAESFEIHYHPNQYARLFLFSSDSLDEATSLICHSHPDYMQVSKSDVKIPYISIKSSKSSEEKIQIFFC
jgi:hypothetical protein